MRPRSKGIARRVNRVDQTIADNKTKWKLRAITISLSGFFCKGEVRVLQGCTSCGLTDQVKSIRQILGIRNESQFTEVRGAILQPGEAQVQPVFGYTQTSPDANLAALQKKLTEYTSIPWRASAELEAFYRKYLREVFGAVTLIVTGLATVIFFGIGLIPLFFGIKFFRKQKQTFSDFSVAREKERQAFLLSHPEYQRKINGWYCQRCGLAFSAQ